MSSLFTLTTLQHLWWGIVSLVAALFVFMTFVQGGQTLLLTEARTEEEQGLIVNSIGRKWELTFTALVLLGGSLFAAFPLFYATSFGGAYWLWILVLSTFILQAVSFEYRRKPGNVFGKGIYDLFLFLNGCLGPFLVGVVVGSFFTGLPFSLGEFNSVTWHSPLRGIDVLSSPFNIAFGLFLVFLSRLLGALYLSGSIEDDLLVLRLRRAAFRNLVCLLPFLLFVLARLVMMEGYSVDAVSGIVSRIENKYLYNLQEMPLIGASFLAVGVSLVALGGVTAAFLGWRGIWPAGLGTVLAVLAVFFIAGLNDTPFYPSTVDLQSSLTIHNASSSSYTLTIMSIIALGVPFVLAYIAWVWRLMDARKITAAEVAELEDRY